MSDILVVFASKQEFNIIFPQKSAIVAASTPMIASANYDVAVCGVGVVDFAANLSFQLSQKRYRRVYLVGICGAYLDRDLGVGEVVRVDSDVVGDMGVQNRDGHFVPYGELCGESKVYAGESPRRLPLMLASIRSVKGVTVNCCTGTNYLSIRRSNLYDADVESMEGAAFFAVCKRFGVEAYQFRAVSNIAADRDTSLWKIQEALEALKTRVLDLL